MDVAYTRYCPSIKYVTLFWTNFDSLPCNTLPYMYISGTKSTSQISDHPWILVVHAYILMSLQGVCFSSRRFLLGEFFAGFFYLEGFVRGGFCPSPLLS